MKKIVAIVCLFVAMVAASESKAQVQTMTSATTYSVVDTGTINLGLKLNEPWATVSIQYIGTKVSGTVGGTAKLWGSIDGTNYVLAPNLMFKDTLNAYTNTDVTTNTKIWVVDRSPYLYYRVAVAGTGTMVATVAAYVLPRK